MNLNIETFPGVIKKINAKYDRFYCHVSKFEEGCFYLKSHIDYAWLIDMSVIDKNGSFELRYLFHCVEDNYFFYFIVDLPEQSEMKSIAHLWTNAIACEAEAHELFGIKFNRHYKAKFFHRANSVHPLRKKNKKTPKPKNVEVSENTTRFEHPFIRNQFSLHIEEENHLIRKCEVESGSYHIGLEKILEGLGQKESYSLVENYFANEGSFCSFLLSHNIERHFDIEIPGRAKALRMVIIEFGRVTSHLNFFRDLYLSLRNDEMRKDSLIWIQRIQSLMMSFCGNEHLLNLNRIGGLIKDVSQAWLLRVMEELLLIEQEIIRHYRFLQSSEKLRRDLNIKLLEKAQVTKCNLTGPMVRASGLNLDYRKNLPIYFYDDVDFEIPVGANGTIFDLVCVKFEEVFQSFRIITQVIDNLPTGKINDNNFLDFNSNKTKFDSIDEKQYLEEMSAIYNVNDFDNSFYYEGYNGVLGINHIVKNNVNERIKFFSNDIFLKPYFESLLKGRGIDEVELIWTALNINMKMVER